MGNYLFYSADLLLGEKPSPEYLILKKENNENRNFGG